MSVLATTMAFPHGNDVGAGRGFSDVGAGRGVVWETVDCGTVSVEWQRLKEEK